MAERKVRCGLDQARLAQAKHEGGAGRPAAPAIADAAAAAAGPSAGPIQSPPVPSPTEDVHPRGADLDRLPPEGVVALMAEDEARTVEAFRRAAPALGALARAAAAALAGGGRIVFAGAGTSGRLGVLEAAECPPTFGSDPARVQAILAGGPGAVWAAVEGAEDRAEEGAAAIDRAALGAADLVIGIAASGRTPFVRGALARAAARGARTGLVTCNPALAAEAPAPADHVVVLDTGPEVVAGSTRLKAGTATKMALNAITTAAFAALGKVHEGLMVDVRATNDKLRARARRIVSRLTGAGAEEVERALAAAGGEVKLAVLALRVGLDGPAAAAALDAAGGCLRRALEAGGAALPPVRRAAP